MNYKFINKALQKRNRKYNICKINLSNKYRKVIKINNKNNKIKINKSNKSWMKKVIILYFSKANTRVKSKVTKLRLGL